MKLGGDADTNAAVAGALLGAKFGPTAIPKRWLDGLLRTAEIEDAFEMLLPLVVRSEGEDAAAKGG